MRLAVIIPFFQRERGILRRALASIAAQRLPEGTLLDVLVVDDASPLPAEQALEGFTLLPPHSLRIVARAGNGGPGEARNTGLDALPPGTDAVALLDSDDEWEADHLANALAAFAAGAQVYFSNHLTETGEDRFATLPPWAEALPGVPADALPGLPAEATGAGLRQVGATALFSHLVQSHAVHLSTLVFCLPALSGLRFAPELRFAGEDVFFVLCLVQRLDAMAMYSSRIGMRRGRGVSVYASTHNWSHPDCIRGAAANLRMRLRIGETFALAPPDKAVNEVEKQRLRLEVTMLLVRNIFRHFSVNLGIGACIRRYDASFWPGFPGSLRELARRKLQGRSPVV